MGFYQKAAENLIEESDQLLKINQKPVEDFGQEFGNKDKKSKLLNQEKDKLEKENEKLESEKIYEEIIEKDKNKISFEL